MTSLDEAFAEPYRPPVVEKKTDSTFGDAEPSDITDTIEIGGRKVTFVNREKAFNKANHTNDFHIDDDIVDLDICGSCKKSRDDHDNRFHTFAKLNDPCYSCGNPANNHHYRHMFTNIGEKKEFCAHCNIESSIHPNTSHFFAHKGDPCISLNCGLPAENHNVRHPFSNKTPDRIENERLLTLARIKNILDKEEKTALKCTKYIRTNNTYIPVLKPNKKDSYNYCYFCATNCMNINKIDYSEKCKLINNNDHSEECYCGNCMWNN